MNSRWERTYNGHSKGTVVHTQYTTGTGEFGHNAQAESDQCQNTKSHSSDANRL